MKVFIYFSGVSSEDCEDNNGWCPNWASYGYCDKWYVAWMNVNCKKSCNVC